MSGSRGRAPCLSLLQVRRIVRNGEILFGHEFPDEGTEFTGDGDDDFLFAFATCFEPDITFVEAVLHAPREGFDGFGLAFLAFAQRSTNLGSLAIVLSAFNKHPSGMAVPALGDGTLSTLGATAFFTRNKSKESHELARMLEST